jgi:hypothetical protein
MMRARAGKRFICGPFSTPLVAFHSSSELEGARRYRLTIITNADDESDDVSERVTEADGGVEKSRVQSESKRLEAISEFCGLALYSLSERESRHAQRQINSDLAFDRQRLQGYGATGSADQHLGA